MKNRLRYPQAAPITEVKTTTPPLRLATPVPQAGAQRALTGTA